MLSSPRQALKASSRSSTHTKYQTYRFINRGTHTKSNAGHVLKWIIKSDATNAAATEAPIVSSQEVPTGGLAAQEDAPAREAMGPTPTVVIEQSTSEAAQPVERAQLIETIQVQPVAPEAVPSSGQRDQISLQLKAAIGVGVIVLGTLALAVYRYWQKYNTPQSQRIRQVNKNKKVSEELASYLPDRRDALTPGVMQSLKSETGFTMVELFRKYLWFVLRERKFGPDVVADLVAVKRAAGLTEADVAEALRERAQRIYDQYGTLMLNTEGMTASGIEKKATCRALFTKMLFLVEHEDLTGKDGLEAVDLRKIFGATEEDIQKFRLVSIYEVDIDKLDQMASSEGTEEA